MSGKRSRSKTPRWLAAARATGGASTHPDIDWLARALGRAGVMDLRTGTNAIAAGRIRLNGRVVHLAMTAVSPGDRIMVDGQAVDIAWHTRVLMFHKPEGVICAGTDPSGIGTVFERVAAALPTRLTGYQWHCIGRLDRNTTGLLLFTNDERLVAFVTSPQTHLAKSYTANVAADASDAALEPLRRGLTLHDGPCRPALATVLGTRRIEVVLTEGRNHQVKHMLAAVGLPVVTLHRSRIGQLELDIAVGEVREVSPEEIHEKLGYAPRANGVL